MTNLISLLYMSVFLISEVTGLGFLLEMYGINPLVAQIVLCISTALYTALSGMKSSLLTDKFQGYFVVFLITIVLFGSCFTIQVPGPIPEKLVKPSQAGWESLYTLIVANLSANVFHMGYWQRVYSSKSSSELIKATGLASLMTFPVMFIIGFSGIVSVWIGVSESNDPLAFFSLAKIFPVWVNALILVIATAFISSSVDTLQNGITALLVNDIFGGKLKLARILSVLLNVPVLLLALKGFDVLTLFLVADLMAAVVVCPTIIGLVFGVVREQRLGTPSSTPAETNKKIAHIHNGLPEVVSRKRVLPNGLDFVVGIIGGISSIIGFGAVFHGNILDGIKLLGLPNGLSALGESMGAFIAAPVGSTVFMLLSWKIRTLFCKEAETPSKPTIFSGNLALE